FHAVIPALLFELCPALFLARGDLDERRLVDILALPIRCADGQPGAVRREGQRGDAATILGLDRRQLLAGGHVPEPYRALLAAGGQQLAVGREGRAVEAALVLETHDLAALEFGRHLRRRVLLRGRGLVWRGGSVGRDPQTGAAAEPGQQDHHQRRRLQSI